MVDGDDLIQLEQSLSEKNVDEEVVDGCWLGWLGDEDDEEMKKRRKRKVGKQ